MASGTRALICRGEGADRALDAAEPKAAAAVEAENFTAAMAALARYAGRSTLSSTM